MPDDRPKSSSTPSERSWDFLSNHTHVLLCLARDPNARLRDVAIAVGITERAIQRIVRDLQDIEVISVEREGRRNRYTLHPSIALRHPLESSVSVGDLLQTILEPRDVRRLGLRRRSAR